LSSTRNPSSSPGLDLPVTTPPPPPPPQQPSQPSSSSGGDESKESSSVATTGTTFKMLVFIVAIQLFALFITKVNAPVVAESGVQYDVAGTSSGGSLANALILVFFVFLATLAAVWLVRQRRVKVFMAFIFLGTSIALFLLTLLSSLSVTSSYMDPNSSFYLSLAFASATVVILALVTLHRIPSGFALLLTGLLSAEVGSYFASTIPILTAMILPLVFSLYDIYTVFRGPLRSLVTTLPMDSLSAVSSKIGDFSIGTGDTVFYAMVPALAYYRFAISSAFVALVAVDIGVAITLYLLSRAKLLPGLPIPMFLGMAVLLVFYFR
jgi:hypothetical protein